MARSLGMHCDLSLRGVDLDIPCSSFSETNVVQSCQQRVVVESLSACAHGRECPRIRTVSSRSFQGSGKADASRQGFGYYCNGSLPFWSARHCSAQSGGSIAVALCAWDDSGACLPCMPAADLCKDQKFPLSTRRAVWKVVASQKTDLTSRNVALEAAEGGASVGKLGKDGSGSNGSSCSSIGLMAGQQQEQRRLGRQSGRLIDNGFVYSETFFIRCYEVGVDRTARIDTIANLLQEVAVNHARCVGFTDNGFGTTPAMRQKRLIWVTTRLHVEMLHYPAWGDVVEIQTWLQQEGKVNARRDWVISDARTGQLVGRATSAWVMMSQDTRRLVRIPEEVKAEYLQYCFPHRHAIKDKSASGRKIERLEDPPEFARAGLQVRRSDLDMNQHVNNVTYVGWMIESIPLEVLDNFELLNLTLDYRCESVGDDVIESLTSLEVASPDCPLAQNEVLDSHLAWLYTSSPSISSNQISCQNHLGKAPMDRTGLFGSGSQTSSRQSHQTSVSSMNTDASGNPQLSISGQDGARPNNHHRTVAGKHWNGGLEDKGRTLQFLHLLRLQNDGKELVRGRTLWQKRKDI
ncbi:hypothetical protein CBR_g52636 [Chara braunii]|uniref:Acyl-[acyl-carrier-protein] hydrolase n=1 Tax=Chara braunii TaxID=69332 RepID=A0A388MAS3_CHABU|nr:hypothetical protein CBR_g52636 [Chara braunii]|eukprot:GBG91603.1 hypothetical protein CBR_g52636 [Chara braunii]